jgi:short-subunit dehydrogenase
MKKVVLITGGSSGLGKQLVSFLRMKEYIVYSGVRKKDSSDAYSLSLDVTNFDQCEDAIKTIIQKEGRVDVIINNAGNTIVGPFENFSDKDFLQLLDVNTVGAFRLMKAVLPYMEKQKGGRIINITSLNGSVALPNFSLYSASKFALDALGSATRIEMSKKNICITNVAPGAMKRESSESKALPHKSAREKFLLLRLLMPIIEYKDVVQEVVKIIESKYPPLRVVIGNDAKITLLVQKILPASFFERLLQFVWNT